MRKACLAVSIVVSACGLFPVTTPAAQVNLLRNPSFESPPVPSGASATFPLGSNIDGWTVVAAPGNVAVVSGASTVNGFHLQAGSGAQWLNLAGTWSTATGVEQTVPTLPGTLYDFSIAIGSVFDPGGSLGASTLVNVFVNGVFQASGQIFGSSLGVPNAIGWGGIGFRMAATTDSVTLRIVNGDSPSDALAGIDTVFFGPTLIPEPPTAALLLVGMAAFVLRRRWIDPAPN